MSSSECFVSSSLHCCVVAIFSALFDLCVLWNDAILAEWCVFRGKRAHRAHEMSQEQIDMFHRSCVRVQLCASDSSISEVAILFVMSVWLFGSGQYFFAIDFGFSAFCLRKMCMFDFSVFCKHKNRTSNKETSNIFCCFSCRFALVPFRYLLVEPSYAKFKHCFVIEPKCKQWLKSARRVLAREEEHSKLCVFVSGNRHFP